jgi:ATP-dependent DNA helicase RecG
MKTAIAGTGYVGFAAIPPGNVIPLGNVIPGSTRDPSSPTRHSRDPRHSRESGNLWIPACARMTNAHGLLKANAFIHRDYASASGAVAIALYDDRLEVISPGELHFGLTPDMLFQPHESKPWNPWIAKAFHRRGIIETWGRGTLKIASLMQAAGLPVPTLQERTQSVVMTFVLPATPEKSSEKSSEKILWHLRQEPTLSAKALAEKLSLSSRAIEKQIDLLKKDGQLQRIGPAKGGHWKVIE